MKNNYIIVLIYSLVQFCFLQSGLSATLKQNIAYSIESNLAEEAVDGRLYYHQLRYSPSIIFSNRWSLFGSMSASYQSVDSEVIEKNDKIVEFSTFTFGINTDAYPIYRRGNIESDIRFTLGNSLPVSSFSYENGYLSIPYAKLTFNQRYRSHFNFKLSAKAAYVVDSDDGELGELNRLESFQSISPSFSFNYNKGNISVGYNFENRNYTKSESTTHTASFVSLGYQPNKYFSASIDYSESSWFEEQIIDTWLSNPYVKVTSLNLGVRF